MASESGRAGFLKGFFPGIALLSAAQLGAGYYLSQHYRASLDGAHASVETIRSEPILHGLAGFHYWGSAVLILLTLAGVLGMAWSGWPKEGPREWFGMLFTLGGAFALQVTGNLLPLDRHDVQTAVMESAVASRTPGVGGFAARTMLQGETFGEATLSEWYFVHHWVFPALLLAGLLLLLPGNIKLKGVAWIILLPTVMSLALGFLIEAPNGPAATAIDYTLSESTVSWYAWPIHGALKAFDAWSGQGWIGSALMPSLFGVFLLTLPWISRRLSLAVTRVILAAFVCLFIVCGSFYAGKAASITGDQPVGKQLVKKIVKPNEVQPIDEDLAKKGQQLFNSMPCADCHGRDGIGGAGGPSLQLTFKRHPNREWLRKFISQPDAIKPGTIMPSFKDVPAEDLDAIIEWVRSPK